MLVDHVDCTLPPFVAEPITREFGLWSVTLGDLFSSFLWTYTLCLLSAGMLVNRSGTKRVAGFGIGI